MIELDNVSVNYGGIHALEGVSAQFRKGEITTILGSNGAGKSTLINAICGRVPVADGTIRLNGAVLNGLPVREIVTKGIALVPEGRELFPRMSVLDNLLCGAHLRSNRKEIAADLEKVFSFFPVLQRKKSFISSTLSGGEQQMLAIGRALMANPKFFIFDEPSIGLAPIIEAEVVEAIGKLTQDAEVGVILVEQNASLALKVADKGYVLELGRITIEGSAAALANDDRVRRAYLGQ